MQPTAIALLALSCALLARPARAADVPSEHGSVWLDIKRGPGTEQCIEASALQRSVEQRLHRVIFERDARAPLRISLILARRPNREWSADLALETASGAPLGQRTIATGAAHCSSLDDSIALVVALLVDTPLAAEAAQMPFAPQAAPAARAPSESAANAPRTAKQTEPASASKPESTTIRLPQGTFAPREPWRLEGSLGATLAVGLLPGDAFGLELGLAGKPARGPDLRLFGGAYQRRDAFAGPGGSGARFTLFHLGLEVCPLEGRFRRVRWSACGGQSVGSLRVASFGFDQNSPTTRLTFALLGGAALVVPIVSAVAARVSARAEIPLARGVFTYGARDGSEHGVFQMSSVVGVFEAALVVSL